MFDDKDLGVVFPTRTGTAAGTGQERVMLDHVGANSIRTYIVGDTMLRTRNGMPEFSSLNTQGSSAASLDRGFCCRHYLYIPIPTTSDALRINYVSPEWKDGSTARIETPTRYSITGQFSDKTGYADVIGYANGLCVNGVQKLETTFNGTPFLLTANLDVVAVTDDSVTVGRKTQAATYTTGSFKQGLSPALSGAGSSHLCRVLGESAHVWLFGGYMTDNRRMNYDIELLATPSMVSVVNSQTGWFNDGGNVRLVDYDSNPQTSTDYQNGEWRDPPGCVLRTSPGLLQLTYTTEAVNVDHWNWIAHFVQIIPIPTRFGRSGWYQVDRYSNVKELKESAVAGGGFTLSRNASATVRYERTRSNGWAVSWHYGNEEAGTSVSGGYFYPGKYGSSVIGPVNTIAHGGNERYTNTASTTQSFTLDNGLSSIALVSAEFSIDSDIYHYAVDYAKSFACHARPSDFSSYNSCTVAPDYDLYFIAYSEADNNLFDATWEYGKTETVIFGALSGSVVARDYLYYDEDNGVELWLEFKGEYAGSITAATPIYVPVSSTLSLCANIFGTRSEVEIASSRGDLNPASLEVDYIPGENHKPAYAPINHCPCVFAPKTHQGAFEYIAYMTKVEREHSPKMDGTFYLSLPLFVTRTPPADSEVPTPDFPALTVIPKNIEAFTGRFASSVLTQNGTKVFHITAQKSGSGWVLASATNDGRNETAWRY